MLRAVRWLGNTLVVLLLAGLAWWGHETGWKLPGQGQASPAEDWCTAHCVPESICVECNAKKWPRAKSPGWCKTHGVHECLYEHPELAQVPSPPRVTAEMREGAKQALAFTERPGNTSRCRLHLRRIQFASEAAAERAGIEVYPVTEGTILEGATAAGEIGYDQTRLARLSSRVAGTVWRVEVVAGQKVRRGQVLGWVDSMEVGKARAELLQALAQVQVRQKFAHSMQEGARSGAIPEARYQEAEASLQEARIRLAGAEQALTNLGLPVRAEDLQGLTPAQQRARLGQLGLPASLGKTLEGQDNANLIPITAPLEGIVVQREIVAGEVVDPSKLLFVVADTSKMWLTLHVRMEDARHLAVGQRVLFRPDGQPREHEGKLDWVSTSVEEKTRTVRVRATLENADGSLRAGTFGSGRIVFRVQPHAIVVPAEALQYEGCCHVVFVRDQRYLEKEAPKVFHTRTVRPGARDGGMVEMIAGVLPGELVVTRGSALLRSELLKNNLGAG